MKTKPEEVIAEAIGWLDVGAPGRAREVLLSWLRWHDRPEADNNWQAEVARDIQRVKS
jgi:hypothetical protein